MPLSFRVKYDLNSGSRMKTIVTDWEVYMDKHVHGAQPRERDVAEQAAAMGSFCDRPNRRDVLGARCARGRPQ